MAFGIDDALSLATGGIKITETVVETINRYRKSKLDYDLELLLEEVRVTALRRIDEADLALTQFERTIVEKKVDIDQRLRDVIAKTPFWQPFEQHRLSQIQKQFNQFSDRIYGAVDDIAALVRCRQETGEMGAAIVASAEMKHDLHAKVLGAKSLREAIELLRAQLKRHKAALTRYRP